MTKSELRKIYLARKKALSDRERISKSAQINEHFFQNIDLKSVRFLHLFLSIADAGEVETVEIIRRLWEDFPTIKTVVPRINRTTKLLESVEYNSDSNLIINSFGIREPAEDKIINAEEIDLVITPLLCFDNYGHRVGYGAGFYDKFFKTCRPDCRKIGVSFYPPVDEITDVDEFDVAIDICVTPEGVWRRGE